MKEAEKGRLLVRFNQYPTMDREEFDLENPLDFA
jgi:hypothetical protein